MVITGGKNSHYELSVATQRFSSQTFAECERRENRNISSF